MQKIQRVREAMEVEKTTMVKASIFSNNYCTDHDEEMLPGFRFHPTDEELVGFYLRRKVEKKLLSIELIKHVDIYKYDPWDLPKVSNVGEKEWYFFCRRGRKYRNSIRPNRVTGSGFWKATGIDKPIYSVGETHRDCIGLKKSLVYYRGSAGKGTKTDWMMHEFRLPPIKCSDGLFNSKDSNNNAQEAEVWTLCRIIKRERSNRNYTSDFQKTSSIQNIYATDSNSSISCSFNSDDDDRQKNKTSGVFGTDERKLVGNIDYTNEMTKELLAGKLSLASSQVPCSTGSYLSFSDQSNGGDGFSGDRNWDELRPMIDFALAPSSLFYSFR